MIMCTMDGAKYRGGKCNTLVLIPDLVLYMYMMNGYNLVNVNVIEH